MKHGELSKYCVLICILRNMHHESGVTMIQSTETVVCVGNINEYHRMIWDDTGFSLG